MKKKKLGDHEESDHKSLANFENLFFDRDGYFGDFDDQVYNKINVD